MKEVTIITAEPFTLSQYWKLMKKHRSLIWVFALQEIKTMYAQTHLGILWAIGRPLVTLAIFTVIFNYFLKVETQSPYYLFAFAGMISWNLFSQIATMASTAVVQKQQLIRKMFFPKLILPLSKVIIVGVEFIVSLVMLFVFMLWEKFNPGVGCFKLTSFCVSKLSRRARDRHLGQCPDHSLSRYKPSFTYYHRYWYLAYACILSYYDYTCAIQFFVYINPLAGIIGGYRYALLGEPFPELAYWWSMLFFVGVLIVGVWYFIQSEDDMVDYA